MLNQGYEMFWPKQSCQDTWATDIHYTKRCKVLLVTSKDEVHFAFPLV